MKSKKNIDDLLREAMESNPVPNFQWNDFSAKINSKNLYWQRMLNRFFILFIGITLIASAYALRDGNWFDKTINNNEIVVQENTKDGREVHSQIETSKLDEESDKKALESPIDMGLNEKDKLKSKSEKPVSGQDANEKELREEKSELNNEELALQKDEPSNENNSNIESKNNLIDLIKLESNHKLISPLYALNSIGLDLNKVEINSVLIPKIKSNKTNQFLNFLKEKSVISLGLESSILLSGKSSNSDPEFVNKNYEQIRNNSEKGGFSYGFILGWNLNLPVNLSFGTGLEYRTTIVNANYNFTIEEVPVIDIDNSIAGYIKLNDTSKQNISFSNTQVQRLISIPLALQYNLRLNKLKQPIIIGGGILLSKNLGFSGETINPVFLDERVDLNTQYSKLWLINNYNLFLRFPIKSTAIGALYGGIEYKSLRLNPSNYGADLTRNYLGLNLIFNINQ